jgi:hypothetical protein
VFTAQYELGLGIKETTFFLLLFVSISVSLQGFIMIFSLDAFHPLLIQIQSTTLPVVHIACTMRRVQKRPNFCYKDYIARFTAF